MNITKYWKSGKKGDIYEKFWYVILTLWAIYKNNGYHMTQSELAGEHLIVFKLLISDDNA